MSQLAAPAILAQRDPKARAELKKELKEKKTVKDQEHRRRMIGQSTFNRQAVSRISLPSAADGSQTRSSGSETFTINE